MFWRTTPRLCASCTPSGPSRSPWPARANSTLGKIDHENSAASRYHHPALGLRDAFENHSVRPEPELRCYGLVHGAVTTERLELTANEVRVLLLILGVDLDALGLERKDQAAVRAVVKKLRGKPHHD
jgi:hypothetical protein